MGKDIGEEGEPTGAREWAGRAVGEARGAERWVAAEVEGPE